MVHNTTHKIVKNRKVSINWEGVINTSYLNIYFYQGDVVSYTHVGNNLPIRLPDEPLS